MKPEADPDPNQRGGRRGGRDLSGGGRDYIRVGAEGAYTISGGAGGGQVIFEGGLVPPLAPPWIRHWVKHAHGGAYILCFPLFWCPGRL